MAIRRLNLGPNGDTWIEIPVLSTGRLRELQAEVLAATAGNGKVFNGAGDQYRPHVTVGLTYQETLQLPKLSSALLGGSSQSWKVAFGVSGTHCALQSTLNWDE